MRLLRHLESRHQVHRLRGTRGLVPGHRVSLPLSPEPDREVTEGLIVRPAIVFPLDPFLEAAGGPVRTVQRAGRAGNEVLTDRMRLEKATAEQLLKRLALLKSSLQKRLLAETGGLTDFRRFNLNTLLADVDRMIVDTTAGLATDAQANYQAAGDLGIKAIDEPTKALGLTVDPGLPGLDQALVSAAFGNTVDLLTPPMQQFGSQVKQAVRAVALAGDGKMGAIQALQAQISGAGFDGAAYRAERIIRTELGRTFNSATFDRMQGLAKDFPFLLKGWRATKDSRTRQGHVEAGVKYARGQGGIPIAQAFSVNVYDERKGKQKVLIGVCLLRFPVDPLAVPAGKVAAGATILCRCNAFVDYDLAQYAAFAKKQIRVVVPGVPAGTGIPVGVPGDGRKKAPKPALQNRLPKPAKMKGVKVPTAKSVVPKPATSGPGGTPISSKVQLPPGAMGNLGRKAYGIIDQVHGDGPLPVVKYKSSEGYSFYGQLSWKGGAVTGYGDTITIRLSKRGRTSHPLNTTFHETGHWLDRFGLNKEIDPGTRVGRLALVNAGKPNLPGANFESARVNNALLDPLRQAFDNSQTIKTLKTWAGTPVSEEGNGTVPKGLLRSHIRYMLSREETFARAYAQYVATKAGGEALAELKRVQSGIHYGPVKPEMKMNPEPLGVRTHEPGQFWDYPIVWEDADFKPIMEAFDQLFESQGWIVKKG